MIVAAKTETVTVARTGIQARPGPHRGAPAIGARRSNVRLWPCHPQLSSAWNPVTRAPHRRSTPASCARSTIMRCSVVRRIPRPTPRGNRCNRALAMEEADAAKRLAALALQVDSQGAGGANAIGHDAFAAGFVDGRNHTICQHHLEAALSRGNSGSQASRAASDHQNVGVQRAIPFCGACSRASSCPYSGLRGYSFASASRMVRACAIVLVPQRCHGQQQTGEWRQVVALFRGEAQLRDAGGAVRLAARQAQQPAQRRRP